MSKPTMEIVFDALRSAEFEATIPKRRAADSSINRIHDVTGFMRSTVRKHLEGLLVLGRIHVCAWTNAHPSAAVYANSPGENIPKPAALSTEEKREYQRRQRAAERAKRQMAKAVEPPSPSLALRRIDDFINQQRAGAPHNIFAALHGYKEQP